jgi:hypothetical protein
MSGSGDPIFFFFDGSRSGTVVIRMYHPFFQGRVIWGRIWGKSFIYSGDALGWVNLLCFRHKGNSSVAGSSRIS